MTFLEILVYFCFYSVLGWTVDTTYRSFAKKRYVHGGFSKYPFSPVYGFAALGILWLAPAVQSYPLWMQLMMYTILLGAYEYVSGALCLRVLERRLWSYLDTRWNLDGHTGPGYALAWGTLALVIIYVLQPLLDLLIKPLT